MNTMSGTKRVLIVEDDPTFRSFWIRIFDEIGVKDYKILSDPLDAIKLIDKERFDLLISDVVMPHITGYELAKYAYKKNPHMDILLTTGYSTDLSRYDLSGCSFHLLYKPYSNIAEIKKLICHLVKGEDVFGDASEDSYSENEDYPCITEWRL